MNKYVLLGEQGYIDGEEGRFSVVREYPGEFLNLTVHRMWWYWTLPMIYTSREWWRPWEFWPLSCGGWLGLIFALTRRVRDGCCTRPVLAYPVPTICRIARAGIATRSSRKTAATFCLLRVCTLGEIRRLRSARWRGGAPLPRGMRWKCTPTAQKKGPRAVRLLPDQDADSALSYRGHVRLPMHLLSLWRGGCYSAWYPTRSFPHWRRRSPRLRNTHAANWKHCWKSAKRCAATGSARLFHDLATRLHSVIEFDF